MSNGYQERRFDYRYDDRYHRQHDDSHYHAQPYQQQQHQQQYEQQSYQPPLYSQTQYKHDDERGVAYDVVPPAGRANNYNVRISELLTSVRDPPRKDDSLEKMTETNKGYLVMMRFRPSDLSEVVTAVQENLSTLAAHHGYVIGFAEPSDMRILIPSHQMMASDQWWDSRDNRLSRFAVCCFWFKDVFQAKRWFESAHRIKQPDFPNSHPFQVVAVPLTYGQGKDIRPFAPNSEHITLLWSEYPNIFERYQNDFLMNYSDPARHRMKDFGASPHVSICRYKAGWPNEPNKYGQPGYRRLEVQHERVARAIRTGWLLPDTFLNVSSFPSMDAVVAFYRDPEYQSIRNNLDRYSNPVFVAISLRVVKGTSRS